MLKVLFVCVGNSGRSQMAEAFFNHMSKGKPLAFSAGTMPSDRVDPMVIEVMKELDIDISGKKPKQLTAEMLKSSKKVITMGCSTEDVCPATLVTTEDWGLPDPKGKSKEEIRKIRDEIKSRVTRLLEEIV
ncbi:MAG: arsenate reductase ArsC [Dehalococcoidia bacterium]|jgi:arsenate reductase